ncbi:MAG: sugar ABC transporter ATP-binding protein [Clostridiales Family XIII bacterium]|jgi:ABC-type sugar transport system ATPase subunit|nr:sugar ABC transporter ATP-binding protein [Clostridiales Family XIII bacterium]
MIAIEAKNIYKSFPGIKALDDVSIAVEKGEVHAIVGENGAGKSTLMKIFGGLYDMDSGSILINGTPCEIKSISGALSHGISVIYQELNLMPSLTIAENIFVSDLPGSLGQVNYRKLNQQTRELMERLSLNAKPTDLVSTLSVSQRQMVEIMKAVSHNSEIIIMDEPTAALNNQEVDTLYNIIHKLKAEGKTILYISHRLREIFDISDRVTVLRDGRYVGTRLTSELDENALVSMMVGRDISQLYKYQPTQPGETVLEVQNLEKEGVFSDVSFSLREGEIVGVAGLMGCGREEIVKSIYGLTRRDGGRVILQGVEKDIKSPSVAIKEGIGFVTEDRKDSGIFALMTIRENISVNILRALSRWGLIRTDMEDELLVSYTSSMNMKYADEMQRIMFLSGGNQQKFILARALASGCKVLIMLEPTRGIDVGAKAEIYSLLSGLAAKGMAILVISSELPEIMSVCYRSLVVFQGQITGNILRDEMDENLIMRCATGNETYFSKGAQI